MIAMLVINPAWGHIVGVFTVLLMATFIGIWIWAWRKRHKANFDRMARLPLEEEMADEAGADSETDTDTDTDVTGEGRP